jgi:hypothetical protein
MYRRGSGGGGGASGARPPYLQNKLETDREFNAPPLSLSAPGFTPDDTTLWKAYAQKCYHQITLWI